MRARLSRWFAQPGDGTYAPSRLFWTAFVVRLAYIVLAHTFRVRGTEDHFLFGYEAGRIAESLVDGRGYADPFRNAYIAHTGPTAWLPPLYPLVMAAVFRLCGVYTALSAFMLLAFNAVLSAWTACAVWELGARFGLGAGGRAGMDARKLARWSGWLWALYPAFLQYAVKWFWEMTLTTALFAWVLVLAMRMRAEPGRRTLARWSCFGAGWAAIGLANSSLLVFLPVCGLWLLWGGRARLGRAAAGAVVAGALFAALTAPWIVRNQRVFHTFIPFRGNFGAELYLGNGPGARGFLMEYNHPYLSPPQLALYRDMGEAAYVRMRGEAARQVIAADHGLFVRNTLVRVYFFWFGVPHAEDSGALAEWVRIASYSMLSLAGLLGLGLALWRRVPAAGLWGAAVLLLPAPYYIVTATARFRHPLEPLIVVLGVYLFLAARPRGAGGKFSVAAPPRLAYKARNPLP